MLLHGDTPRSIAIGDLDGNGAADLVTVGGASENRPSYRASVLLASAGSPCVVPSVSGNTLAAAKRALLRAHCRVGPIEWRRHAKVPEDAFSIRSPALPRCFPVEARSPSLSAGDAREQASEP